MSNIALYCVVTAETVKFCNNFADVVGLFEKNKAEETIDVYKFCATVGEGYVYYMTLSK